MHKQRPLQAYDGSYCGRIDSTYLEYMAILKEESSMSIGDWKRALFQFQMFQKSITTSDFDICQQKMAHLKTPHFTLQKATLHG